MDGPDQGNSLDDSVEMLISELFLNFNMIDMHVI